MNFIRSDNNPLIHPATPGFSEGEADNINGPSVICVPAWVSNPLGKYYMYFAHHSGKHIRLAYADSIDGPWQIHSGGVLQLSDTAAIGHIASPDLHIDRSTHQLRMYFHGNTDQGQRTFVAFSSDGLHWQARPEILCYCYLRAFEFDGAWYGITRTKHHKSGILVRSNDGLEPFTDGELLIPGMRHCALLQAGSTLHIFYSRIGDCPERILYSRLNLSDDWHLWPASLTEPIDVLIPEKEYEGATLPLEASSSGAISQPVRQLRDPEIFVDGQTLHLFYSVAGESAIARADCPIRDIIK